MTRRTALFAAAWDPASEAWRRIDPASASDSGMPSFATAPDGGVYLSWTDPLSANEHALRFSRWTGRAWSAPETITRGTNWFVNWADFPALTALADGSLFAHWLQRNPGADRYGYGIRIACRPAGPKAAWRQVHAISDRETTDYAGFLAFVPGQPAAIYLAPPAGATGHQPEHHLDHRKTVRFVRFTPGGQVSSDVELDASACSCCNTVAGVTRHGLIAAYRDRLPGEIRDISVVRFTHGRWSAPRPLHADGWRIHACPTDGPALTARDTTVGVAWLTRAQAKPRVLFTFSSDEGETFRPPLRLDDGQPLGRPALIELPDAAGWVAAWLEKLGENRVELRLRRISASGQLSRPVTLTRVPVGRASGVPKLAVAPGGQLLAAWRDERVRAALFTPQLLLEMESR